MTGFSFANCSAARRAGSVPARSALAFSKAKTSSLISTVILCIAGPLLLRPDRLGQGLQHVRHHVLLHQLVEDPPLVAVALGERLERLLAPELPDGEVHAHRRFGELPGPHLVRTRPGLDAQPGLKLA